MIAVVKKIKEEMKDCIKVSQTSSVDLQNMIKGTGFSFLSSVVQGRETIVQLQYAQEYVQQYIGQLVSLLPSNLLASMK